MDSSAVLGLVKRAQGGEKEAFGELYDQYASRIYRFIKIHLDNDSQAEDILQETFLKAWLALPKLKLENLNFSAWLYKIARNLVNDHYRQTYRRPREEDIAEHFELADKINEANNLDHSMMIEKIKTLIPKLKPVYRQVIELRFVQEFSVYETAVILNRSQVAVRLLQYRALQRLRNLLEQTYVA